MSEQSNITTVRIAPEVALQEARAEIDFLRNRSIRQAQAIADLQAELEAARAEAATPAPTDSDTIN